MHWQKPVKIAWGCILLLAIVVLIAGAAARTSYLENDPYGFAVALEQIGLSTEFFAVYFTIIEILFALLFMTIGVLIFWKASNDWMAILVSAAFITFGVYGIGFLLLTVLYKIATSVKEEVA